jgi:hypothetical protein
LEEVEGVRLSQLTLRLVGRARGEVAELRLRNGETSRGRS